MSEPNTRISRGRVRTVGAIVATPADGVVAAPRRAGQSAGLTVLAGRGAVGQP